MNDRSNEVAPQEVLEEVTRILREVIGEEWADELAITNETSFSGDLELESIEFVALAEKLKGVYGARVDFAGWLASMELKEILQLRVGALVDFIVRCSSPSTKA
ncbi:MAG: phosphopantetheine-binding protein [Polyangiales bacterium]